MVAVQNPLSSLADDVAATSRVINMQAGHVILVGQSWGGAVITEAGNNDKVAALVYISAFAPDLGQSINDIIGKLKTGPLKFDLRSAQGKLTLMAALAEFERDLLRERVRSGIAAARKRGVVFGRRPGHRVKADRPHAVQGKMITLTTPSQHSPPDHAYCSPEGSNRRAVHRDAVVAHVSTPSMPSMQH